MIYRNLHASLMRFCQEFGTNFTQGVTPKFINFDSSWDEADLPDSDIVGYFALTYELNDQIIEGSFQVGYSTKDDKNLFRLVSAIDQMVESLKPSSRIPVYDADSGLVKGAFVCKNGTRVMPVIGNKNRPVQFIAVHFATTITYQITGELWAVSVAPSIITQPSAQTVAAGATATFTVVASGTGPLTYQWQRNAINISGATSASYTTGATTVSGGTANNADTYHCVVTGAVSPPATSNAATLTVNSDVNTNPMYGVGTANDWSVSPAALLAAMTIIAGSSANGKVGGPFTVSPGVGQYGWVAVTSSVSSSGVTFTDALGAGGWQGAGLSGNNSGASPSTSTSTTLYTDGNGTQWRLFRQDYSNSPPTGSIS